MFKRLLGPVFLAFAASRATAQPPAPVRPPAALVRQLFADLEPDHLLRREGLAEIPKAITVEQRDLNGDGTPEWFVEGTRVCGNANCPRWIYRRLPDGRFQQVYDEGNVRIDVLPQRSGGWPALMSVIHMSCCETVFRRSEWNGRRYAWRDTEYRSQTNTDASKLVYHVAMVDTDARGRRRLVLDPMDAGGGLRIAARHDVCARGEDCGSPTLTLQAPGLPEGRVCVGLSTNDGEGPGYTAPRSERWCGITTPASLPGAAAARQLTIRPTRRDWSQLTTAYEVNLTGPGLPGKLDIDAVGALMAFSWSLRDVYSLPCIPHGECGSTGRD
jgi:hypothetical protein